MSYLNSFDKNNPNYFCIHQLEYQKACEDNILLEDVKNFISLNDKEQYFFLQEFIFGHGEKYMSNLEKSRTRYYNDYLLNLYNYLNKNDLLNNVTIIILSDHGEKGYFEKIYLIIIYLLLSIIKIFKIKK